MKYNIVLCDPPWRYRNYNYAITKSGSRAKRGVAKEYNTMDIDDIRHLPVTDIAADDCVLFMWSTPPLLTEALSVIHWWGFSYLTKAFCWVKTNPKSGTYFFGMGNWSRCVSPDTLIWILDIQGCVKHISISTLYELDIANCLIHTSHGWKKILHIWKNSETKTVTINTNVGDVICSHEHRWLTKYITRPGSSRCGYRKAVPALEFLSVREIIHKRSLTTYKTGNESLGLLFPGTAVESTNIIHYVCDFKLTDDIGYLIGLFVAEGNYGYGSAKNQIRFSLHKKETLIADKISKTITDLNLSGDRYYNLKIKTYVYLSKDTNQQSIYFSSSRIKQLFSIFIIGCGAHFKRLNLELLYQTSVSFRKSVLQGILDGDGTKDVRGYNNYRAIYLCNKLLIEDLYNLCLSLGISCHKTKEFINYKNNTKCFHYGLYFNNSKKTYVFDGVDVDRITINNIVENSVLQDTFDIEVDGGHFVANGLISHNSNTEDCLLAIKGKPKRVSASVHQIITAPVGKHSHKPDIVRDKIVELCGDIPRIELFAREQALGWDALGFDIDGLDIRDSLNSIIGVL